MTISKNILFELLRSNKALFLLFIEKIKSFSKGFDKLDQSFQLKMIKAMLFILVSDELIIMLEKFTKKEA